MGGTNTETTWVEQNIQRRTNNEKRLVLDKNVIQYVSNNLSKQHVKCWDAQLLIRLNWSLLRHGWHLRMIPAQCLREIINKYFVEKLFVANWFKPRLHFVFYQTGTPFHFQFSLQLWKQLGIVELILMMIFVAHLSFHQLYVSTVLQKHSKYFLDLLLLWRFFFSQHTLFQWLHLICIFDTCDLSFDQRLHMTRATFKLVPACFSDDQRFPLRSSRRSVLDDQNMAFAAEFILTSWTNSVQCRGFIPSWKNNVLLFFIFSCWECSAIDMTWHYSDILGIPRLQIDVFCRYRFHVICDIVSFPGVFSSCTFFSFECSAT